MKKYVAFYLVFGGLILVFSSHIAYASQCIAPTSTNTSDCGDTPSLPICYGTNPPDSISLPNGEILSAGNGITQDQTKVQVSCDGTDQGDAYQSQLNSYNQCISQNAQQQSDYQAQEQNYESCLSSDTQQETTDTPNPEISPSVINTDPQGQCVIEAQKTLDSVKANMAGNSGSVSEQNHYNQGAEECFVLISYKSTNNNDYASEDVLFDADDNNNLAQCTYVQLLSGLSNECQIGDIGGATFQEFTDFVKYKMETEQISTAQPTVATTSLDSIQLTIKNSDQTNPISNNKQKQSTLITANQPLPQKVDVTGDTGTMPIVLTNASPSFFQRVGNFFKKLKFW